MRVTGFNLYRYELPFIRPLKLRGAELRRREGLLLKLSAEDGAEGWGEASPLPGFSRESQEEAADQLHRLALSVIGREPTAGFVDPDGDFGRELDAQNPAPSARFALELALWGLYAASRRKSLPELVSPHPRTSVPVNGLLAGPPDRVLKDARRMRDKGYRAVKLKVGAGPVGEDIELVRALNKELGETVSLRLDANGAWGWEEAEEFAGAGLRFEYVEEPLSGFRELGRFAESHDIPVALDESLVGMGLEDLDEHRYARAAVLKPTMLGGLSRTLRLARRALGLGMKPVVSSSFETGVGTRALVALAAGIGEEEVCAGLDTYRRLAGDVLRPPLDLYAPRVDVGETLSGEREIERDRLETISRS